jgi:hypothetical protein
MQALDLKQSTLIPEEYWVQAVTILASAPNEMELDRHLLRLAGKYPGISDVTKAQQALRREVNKIRRANAAQKAHPERPSIVQTDLPAEEISSAELVVFRAFLSDEFRRIGWMFLRAQDLFSTQLGRLLSVAISTAFSSGPPEGEPSRWIHEIEDELLRQKLSDLMLDPRADNLNEAYIADTVELLTLNQKKRKLQQSRRDGLDTQKRQEYLLRLREQKPNYTKKQQDEDNLFI